MLGSMSYKSLNLSELYHLVFCGRHFSASSRGNSFSQQDIRIRPVLGKNRERPHILVVDDDENIRYIFSAFLKRIGARVSVAQNGLVASSLARGNDYDLILMDMKMPVMDGHQTTRNIMRANSQSRIVAVTAHATENERARCLDDGCIDFISKPLLFEDLAQIISKYTVIKPRDG